MISLVADLGGTRLKIGVVEDGVLREGRTIKSRSDAPLSKHLPEILNVFQSLLTKLDKQFSDCAGVGFGFPSLVDTRLNRIKCNSGKFPDATNLDLNTWCESEMGLPFIIENDARASAIGEWQYGAARGCTGVVMLTLGTGIGSGVIERNAPLRGVHGQAGNYCGHLSYRPGPDQCHCGSTSCFEAAASTWTLPARARRIRGFGQSRIAKADTIDYATVFQAATDGDCVAQELRDGAMAVWGELCVTVIHGFDPDVVVVGGGVMGSADLIIPSLQAYVNEHAVMPGYQIEIVPSLLGDAAALLGLFWMIEQKKIEDNTNESED